MDELLQAHTENKEEPSLYEVGFHVPPNLPEEAVSGEVGKIKDAIISRQGVIVSEGTPQRMNLAYRLPRVIENARTFFDSAYFGCVRFEMLPHELASFEQEMKNNLSVIRFILMRAQPEQMRAPARKMAFFTPKPSMDGRGVGKRAADRKPEKEKTATPSGFTETEMDKTIEELINE